LFVLTVLGVFSLPATSAAEPDEDLVGSQCHMDAALHKAPSPQVSRSDEERPRGPEVLFVNFDGGTITYGPDNAPINQAWQWSGEWPAYGNGADRAATLAGVKAYYGDFNMIVTDERPASGDYSMIMIGPGMGGGVATLDCDNMDHRNVGFVGHSEGDGWGAGTHSAMVAHEAGHTFGLDHVYNADNVMNPTIYSGAVWATECTELTGAGCEHDCGWGQNSYQELMDTFGPSAPDNVPPTVSITSPSDGEAFPVGSEIPIVIEASDDVGVVSVSLMMDGEVISTKSGEPWSWDGSFPDPGLFTIEAIARDDWGNETTSDPVTIDIGGDGDGDGGGDDGGGGSDDSGDDGGDGGDDGGGDDGDDGAWEPDGEDPGTFPPGFGEGGDRDEGCACVVPSARTDARLGWMALAILFVARRRRR
jgi:MYXO-CTERM domain-containing protein